MQPTYYVVGGVFQLSADHGVEVGATIIAFEIGKALHLNRKLKL